MKRSRVSDFTLLIPHNFYFKLQNILISNILSREKLEILILDNPTYISMWIEHNTNLLCFIVVTYDHTQCDKAGLLKNLFSCSNGSIYPKCKITNHLSISL